ncbi:flavin-containing monooxygenase [Pseudoduganella namucuonensis]|uniref:Putative flavoprotein involved in K+ transport n=1 Tax=Pseudoduganella namucuonensis TaxID=1035707 RepID=A0A1I7GZ56_9BURK|nr:NAD(P)/FAD-dependent oxidoreductase [Pseudoduganella namucuonensis]SFU53536.1 putative flavoprotein involved in K+ transport [Pseudoduganella namucuonensis]
MIDCLVVGAGQSGLSCAFLLAAAGHSYQVIDAHRRVGDVWRQRPRNLRLFTSRQFCRLGDMAMPGEQGGFPSAAEFADHLERFAAERRLNVRLDCRVDRVAWRDGAFVATLAGGEEIRARTVINATGSSQVPIVPALAGAFDPRVRQLTAASYRDPDSVDKAGPVLVVGDGASGRQIALELAATHQVVMSMGRKRKLVPNRVLGRDIFWWLTRLGVLYAPTGSPIAGMLRKRDPIPAGDADNERLREAGVTLKPRTSGAAGDSASFSDGSSTRVGTVVWCGGYKEDLGWIALPGVDTRAGHIEHRRGKTAQPGFFVMGRKWLSCRASELVLGAAADAEIVLGHVAEQLGLPGAVSASKLAPAQGN